MCERDKIQLFEAQTICSVRDEEQERRGKCNY